MDVRTATPDPQIDAFPAVASDRHPLRWLRMIERDRVELARFWPVVQNMVVQELRVRYQRSVLGFFWTLLHPVLMMTILTLVFSKIFKTENYALFLFSGMVPWGFLAASLNECAMCIISNEGLIRKIYLPKLIFPLTRTLINLTTFVLSMAALFVLLVPLGSRFTLPMLLLPAVTGLFFIFVLGLGMLVATANTFYRDCAHLVTVILQAWYFATPIIYESNQFPADTRWRFWLNPAYPFVDMFQVIIREGKWPQWTTFMVAAAIASVSLGIGYAAFKSQEDKLVFRL